MFVTHILAPGSIGGLERVVQQLARGQHARGARVEVVAVLDLGDQSAAFVAPLVSAGIPVTPIPLPHRAYLTERRVLTNHLRAQRPDVVHTHGYRADVQAGAVASRLGIPTVTTVHGFTGGGWKNRFYERLQLNAFRRFDRVIAVSDALVRRLGAAGIPPDRIQLLANAAPVDEPALTRSDARRRLGLPQDGPVLGWVGRLSEEKGADVFLRALAALSDRAAVGVLVGAGPEQASLSALAGQLGIAERTVWPGIVPEAGRLFPAFDCFVLSSRTEGTPIVLFEAMAANVGIVATAVGGVPRVVSPEEALLVPPDDPPALAAAIETCFADPSATKRRAQRARQRLELERGLEPWLAAHEEIYRDVLRARRGISV